MAAGRPDAGRRQQQRADLPPRKQRVDRCQQQFRLHHQRLRPHPRPDPEKPGRPAWPGRAQPRRRQRRLDRPTRRAAAVQLLRLAQPAGHVPGGARPVRRIGGALHRRQHLDHQDPVQPAQPAPGRARGVECGGQPQLDRCPHRKPLRARRRQPAQGLGQLPAVLGAGQPLFQTHGKQHAVLHLRPLAGGEYRFLHQRPGLGQRHGGQPAQPAGLREPERVA
ncbi:hypothetical protein D3C79_735880 [compost metagenome]